MYNVILYNKGTLISHVCDMFCAIKDALTAHVCVCVHEIKHCHSTAILLVKSLSKRKLDFNLYTTVDTQYI